MKKIFNPIFLIVCFCNGLLASDLLNANKYISGSYSSTSGTANYTDIANQQFNCRAKAIVPPTYDQTFKKLFANEIRLEDSQSNSFSGKERLMNFLNSILYPNATDADERIIQLEYLSGEDTNLGYKTAKGVLRFDIVCSCKCSVGQRDSITKIFDVEMQRAYESDFVDRLSKYSGSILRQHDNDVIVLALLNYKRGKEQNSSFLIMPFYVNDQTLAPIKPVDDNLTTSISAVYLANISNLLARNEPIYIRGKELGVDGREWLKLFSIEHWGTVSGHRYFIPYSASNVSVKNAILLLSQISEDELNAIINAQTAERNILNTERFRVRTAEAREQVLSLFEEYEEDKDEKFVKKSMMIKANCNISFKFIKSLLDIEIPDTESEDKIKNKISFLDIVRRAITERTHTRNESSILSSYHNSVLGD